MPIHVNNFTYLYFAFNVFYIVKISAFVFFLRYVGTYYEVWRLSRFDWQGVETVSSSKILRFNKLFVAYDLHDKRYYNHRQPKQSTCTSFWLLVASCWLFQNGGEGRSEGSNPTLDHWKKNFLCRALYLHNIFFANYCTLFWINWIFLMHVFYFFLTITYI